MFITVCMIKDQFLYEIDLNIDAVAYIKDHEKSVTFTHKVDGQWAQDTGPATVVYLLSGEVILLSGTRNELIQRFQG